MKIARKTVTMLVIAVLLCALLALAAFAAETGSVWVSVEQDQDEGTAALIVTDTIVTDGVVKVSYNSELLTYESIEISQTYVDMYAVNTEETGVVLISWVGRGNQKLEDNTACLIRLNFTGTGEADQIVLTGSAHGADGRALTFTNAPDATVPETTIADEQTSDASEFTESSSTAEEETHDPAGDGGKNSSTGDTSAIWIAMAVCALCAAAIITLLLGKQHGKGGYAV